jgi:CheY-like chemotaxis protein
MRKHKWILLAEDNAHDADLTLRALKANDANHSVTVAQDGAEALDCLYQRGRFRASGTDPPALVLLDLKMPRVDGLEVLRTVKSDPELKSIPVVVFSSSSEESDRARCYELGANAYVVKPVGYHKYTEALLKTRDFWMNINEPPPQGAAREKLEAASAGATA